MGEHWFDPCATCKQPKHCRELVLGAVNYQSDLSSNPPSTNLNSVETKIILDISSNLFSSFIEKLIGNFEQLDCQYNGIELRQMIAQRKENI